MDMLEECVELVLPSEESSDTGIDVDVLTLRAFRAILGSSEQLPVS